MSEKCFHPIITHTATMTDWCLCPSQLTTPLCCSSEDSQRVRGPELCPPPTKDHETPAECGLNPHRVYESPPPSAVISLQSVYIMEVNNSSLRHSDEIIIFETQNTI